MKQTAVEWFFNELERMQYFIGNDMLEALKEAKEIEKHQIIDAFNLGQQKEAKQEFWTKGEQYYNETFKK